MPANAPRVFVSSTFYDLKYIRESLHGFIVGLGYEPLLSEFPSFPIAPDLNTIDNCERRVRENADMLVLIIGGRYGDDSHVSSRSVTNLEYLAARANGIPVWAFVDSAVLTLFETWRANPTADFSAQVQNPKVFEFIREVRETHNVWTRPFTTADDILQSLRMSWANFFGEILRWQRRVVDRMRQDELQGLHGEALRIALERPQCWEHLLFCQALAAEVTKHYDLRREHKIRVTIGPGEHLAGDDRETIAWLRATHADLARMVKAIQALFGDEGLQHALGPRGVAGSVRDLASTARSLGTLYLEMLNWSLRLRRATVPDEFQPLVDALDAFCFEILDEFDSFGPRTAKTIADALAGGVKTLDLAFAIKIPKAERFDAAMDELRRRRPDLFT